MPTPFPHHALYAADATTKMVQLPQAVFNHILDKQMSKHVRPPTKKHLGTQMRKVKPFITTPHAPTSMHHPANTCTSVLPPVGSGHSLQSPALRELARSSLGHPWTQCALFIGSCTTALTVFAHTCLPCLADRY